MRPDQERVYRPQVYMYPTIEHVEGSKIQVQGDPLTLLCKARGAPTPTVTWYKGEHPPLTKIYSPAQ